LAKKALCKQAKFQYYLLAKLGALIKSKLVALII